jgi:hypothetical protein
MKLWFFFTLLGLVGGIPLGAYVKALYDRHNNLKLQLSEKHHKAIEDNKCRGRTERDSWGNRNRCPSPKSTVCIDSLCPEHCKELHQDECRKKFM